MELDVTLTSKRKRPLWKDKLCENLQHHELYVDPLPKLIRQPTRARSG